MRKKPEKREDIIKRLARNGDAGRSAFVEIYYRYAPGIYRTGLHYLQSPAPAEDLVQDVFFKLWSKRKDFSHIQDLEKYLEMMARNEAFRQFRKLASEEKIHREFSDRTNPEKPAAFSGPSDEFTPHHISQEYESLLQVVEMLPSRQKQIFKLAKLHGLSHQEIADRLNLSPKTVNNHITEALKYLRTHGQLNMILILLSILS